VNTKSAPCASLQGEQPTRGRRPDGDLVNEALPVSESPDYGQAAVHADGNACADGDECSCGVNINYPLCKGPDDTGSYEKWTDIAVFLFDAICDLDLPIAKTAAATYVDQISEYAREVRLRISVDIGDSVDHCGQGFFIDEVQLYQLISGWNGSSP
jgi:hypothetical protein